MPHDVKRTSRHMLIDQVEHGILADRCRRAAAGPAIGGLPILKRESRVVAG